MLFSQNIEIIHTKDSDLTKNMLKTRNFFYKKCFSHIIDSAKQENISGSTYALVAGGSVLDYYMNKEITNDFDIYFENNDFFEYYLTKIQEGEYEVVNKTPHAVLIKKNGYLYHLIKPSFVSGLDAFKTFDFNVCCLGVNTRKEFLYERTALNSIYEKSLKLINISDPLSTFKRLQKYIKKGFEIKNDYVFFEFVNLLYRYYNSPDYKNKIVSKFY